jgi:iron complex outermembrane recepter protein
MTNLEYFRSLLYKILAVIVLILTFLSGGITFGQILYGVVTDEQHNPLQGVNTGIRILHRFAATDQSGKFRFSDLPEGNYMIEFSIIGYKTIVLPVSISGDTVERNVTLQVNPLQFRSITVTANPNHTDVLETPQPVSVVEGRDLDRNRGQSVMQTIETMPGVSMSSNGPLSMKPIIRGLGGQRVVVAENGLRHESQQWDDDQTPEIDAMDVDRIEIVRGPNSVMFGSDALGGVVNIISTDPQALGDINAGLRGNIILNGFSNSKQGAGSFSLAGKNDNVAYKVRLGLRHAENIATPAGELQNTGEHELNGSAMIGMREDWGNLAMDYSHFGQHSQIYPDPDSPAGAAPYQDVAHDKLSLHFDLPLSFVRLESHAHWQKDEENEFDDAASHNPTVDLALTSLTLDIKAHHNPTGPFFGTIGFSLENQLNETKGAEALIPGFNQFNEAGFIHEEVLISRLGLSAGLRLDERRLHVNDNAGLGVANQVRNYQALTGAFGAVYHASEELIVAGNLGRGWRAPIAEELFVDGVDQGGMRYKTGNPNLKTEASFNIDLSLRYVSSGVKGELSFFRNRISDYIYLASTGAQDSASGLIKYATQQANALLTGYEFSIESAVTSYLSIQCGVDMVIGKNEETDAWLPSTPPQRFAIGIRLHEPAALGICNPYLSMNSKIVTDQDRLSDFETPTGGYTLFGAGFGGEIMSSALRMNIDCSINNILNKAYVDHLSRYKNYALNPGRDFVIKLSMPFDIVR